MDNENWTNENIIVSNIIFKKQTLSNFFNFQVYGKTWK